jgi:xanthine dehydrogenase YagS FAD-binding subunit
LKTIPGLDRLRESEEHGLHIGPLVTLATLAADPTVQRGYRALAEAAGHAATPQIRNMATVGGNLLQRPRCWYFRSEAHCKKKGGTLCYAQEGENAYHAIAGNSICAIVQPSATGCALLALDATLEITGEAGARLQPLETFFVAPEQDVRREHSLGPREVITGIRVPRVKGRSSAYFKQGEKESFDWPLAEVAVVLDRGGLGRVQAARIVLGAFAPRPHRARAAEELVVSRGVDEKSALSAARAALKEVRPLAQNGFKVKLFETLIQRTLLEAVRT